LRSTSSSIRAGRTPLLGDTITKEMTGTSALLVLSAGGLRWLAPSDPDDTVPLMIKNRPDLTGR
jgi:hypothetical protein